MNEFYLTFASDHPLGDGWILIKAKDQETARVRAIELFGLKFCTMYPDEHLRREYYPAGQFGETVEVLDD